jgi:hypothetical protein
MFADAAAGLLTPTIVAAISPPAADATQGEPRRSSRNAYTQSLSAIRMAESHTVSTPGTSTPGTLELSAALEN